MKMIEGAKYQLDRNITVGRFRIDAGEVFTLVSFNPDSELSTVEKDGVEFFIDTDYLKPVQQQKPAHYDSSIDTIDFMRANKSSLQVEGFLWGNVVKYLQRYEHKGTPVEDLNKAATYLNLLIEEVTRDER